MSSSIVFNRSTIMVWSIAISRPVLQWSWNYGSKINANDVSAPALQSSCIGRCLQNAHARIYTYTHASTYATILEYARTQNVRRGW